MLVFGETGGIAGTVGGGMLEAKMIEEARRMLPARQESGCSDSIWARRRTTRRESAGARSSF